MGIQYCIGLDPNPKYFEGFLKQEFVRLGESRFLVEFGKSIIAAAKKSSAIIKFQSAFYESFGSVGFKALEDTFKLAKAEDLYCIYDAKRSDIGSTMEAYFDSAFNRLQADAITVTPWMGIQSVIELLEKFKDKEVIFVGLSSNSDGALFQLAQTDNGKPALDRLIKVVNGTNVYDRCGYVVGLTSLPKLSNQQVSLLKSKKILMPGLGFQGGKITKDLLNFSNETSVLLSASRSVTLVGLEEDGVDSWQKYSEWVFSKICALKASI